MDVEKVDMRFSRESGIAWEEGYRLSVRRILPDADFDLGRGIGIG
jgi:hypothetical protein